jgi:hypothetical protein
MGWLDRWLKRGLPAEAGQVSDASILEATAHVVQLVDPRLALCPGYATRLEPGVRKALAHCIEMEAQMPPEISVVPGTWASDSQLFAFFATESDFLRVCSRSTELLQFFDENPLAEAAYGALTAVVVERKVMGPAIVNGMLRQDVLQTTVSFTDHKLTIVAADAPRLRRAISKRAFEELAVITFARGEAESAARQQLDDDRALLLARRQMLARRGTGLDAADASRLQDVDAEIEKNTREMQRIGNSADALERRLSSLIDVLEHAADLISLERRQMRLTNTNHLVGGDCVEHVRQIDFSLATSQRADEPLSRAFLVLELPRALAQRQKPDLDGARAILL